ncbi:MAG: hypothetical protein ACXAAT_17540 [Candidatus Hodarchaeales archaeon]|jgi:hypothetical protein
MLVKEEISRIPWKEYLAKQFIKILGLGFIALLLFIVMVFSYDLDLEILLTLDFSDYNYLIVIILSSLAFIFVLFGLIKIILFDMAEAFGLRDTTGGMVYNLRFWLFAILIVSFCSSIYILLDVQLESTYLVILLVLLIRTGLEAFALNIPELSGLTGEKYYTTIRNFCFDFFIVIILGFSIIFFLAILTTFARRKIFRRFRKEEEEEEIEKQGIRTVYKTFFWILIPPFLYFVIDTQFSGEMANEAVWPIILIISLIAFIWWTYQALKVIFLTVWRGAKITAFITTVNLLVIIPLIFVLWLLPVFILSGADVFNQNVSNLTIVDILGKFIHAFIGRIVDFPTLIQVDFIIITSLATLVVGFAEGFAILAIITALFKGVEVARTGRVLVRSPPKVVVFFKYFTMFGIWLSLLWDSFLEIVGVLVDSLNIDFDITLPDFFKVVYDMIITPISVWLVSIDPILKNIPLLLIPILIIFSGAFKFLSVTLITPRVRERGDFLFLLISTAFVLIVTNILGYIYELEIPDAPFQSVQGAPELISNAVNSFANAEALAFYGGFVFGIGYVFWRIISREKTSTTTAELKDIFVEDPSAEEEIIINRGEVKRDLSETVNEEEFWEETEEEE